MIANRTISMIHHVSSWLNTCHMRETTPFLGLVSVETVNFLREFDGHALEYRAVHFTMS
jgi:hypothetical protein